MLRFHHALLGKALVVVELTKTGQLSSATRSAITASKALSCPVAALVAAGSREILENVLPAITSITDISAVYVSEGEQYKDGKADEFSRLVDAVVLKHDFTHVVAGCSAFGKEVIPLAAACQKCMPICDILKINSENSFVRPMYAGNVIATFTSKNPIHYMTIRTTAFDRAGEKSSATASQNESSKCVVDSFPAVPPLNWSKVIQESTPADGSAPDLTTASIIVSGGRGLKTKENFSKLYPLAKKLGAAVGATRVAVDSGFTSNENQIGQTGKNVAPDLYLAFGISGAIQHLAGIRDAKVVVAVNTDEEAPIAQVADYMLIGDAAKCVLELTEKV